MQAGTLLATGAEDGNMSVFGRSLRSIAECFSVFAVYINLECGYLVFFCVLFLEQSNLKIEFRCILRVVSMLKPLT